MIIPVEQAIEMFGVVYGNPGQTNSELLMMFYQQEPSVIDGWIRLAQRMEKQ